MGKDSNPDPYPNPKIQRNQVSNQNPNRKTQKCWGFKIFFIKIHLYADILKNMFYGFFFIPTYF